MNSGLKFLIAAAFVDSARAASLIDIGDSPECKKPIFTSRVGLVPRFEVMMIIVFLKSTTLP